jgi:uncharacterized SAM-binding protein YcdF (DUF218 family)
MNTAGALKKLWDYLVLSDELKTSDVIFVLGRDDFNIPQKAIEFFQNNLAPTILLSGGVGRLSGTIKGSEANAFRDYIQKQGVPAERILLEESATNTGENISKGLDVLKMRGALKRIILVTHGPHMRRALAVARAQNKTVEWLAAPDSCLMSSVAPERLQKELVGEIDRLVKYPKLGYFEEQNIPNEILAAKKMLE